MKLYYGRGACSLAPHIALHETGLPFSVERVDLKTKRTEGGEDYTQINPNGFVPTLVTQSGERLSEAVAVLLYIADRKPETGLAPAPSSFERYRVVQWLSFVSSELHRSYSPFFAASTPEDYREILRQKLQQRLAYTDAALAGGGLMGTGFTVADAYLFVVLRWSDFAKVDLSPFANLRRFQERTLERPAVRAALQAEGLSK